MNTIMVELDPAKESQPALARAFELIKKTGAPLHLYCNAYKNIDKLCTGNQSVIKTVITHKLRSLLKHYTIEAKNEGFQVTTSIGWSSDADSAVTEEAEKTHCDFIFRNWEQNHGSNGIFHLWRNFDWLLQSPCSVSIIKSQKPWNNIRALVVLEGDDPDRIRKDLKVAQLKYGAFASKYSADIHFLILYNDSLHYPDRKKLLELCHTNNKHIIVRGGPAPRTIADTAKKVQANLLITALPSANDAQASKLERRLENVIDLSPCDIMVIH